MDTEDKTFSNVDKGTAEILKEAKLVLEEKGFVVSKKKEKCDNFGRECIFGML